MLVSMRSLSCNFWPFWLSGSCGRGLRCLVVLPCPWLLQLLPMLWLLSRCQLGRSLQSEVKPLGCPLSPGFGWMCIPLLPPDLTQPASPNSLASLKSPASLSSSPLLLCLLYQPSFHSLRSQTSCLSLFALCAPFCLAYSFRNYFRVSAQMLPPWKGYS